MEHLCRDQQCSNQAGWRSCLTSSCPDPAGALLCGRPPRLPNTRCSIRPFLCAYGPAEGCSARLACHFPAPCFLSRAMLNGGVWLANYGLSLKGAFPSHMSQSGDEANMQECLGAAQDMNRCSPKQNLQVDIRSRHRSACQGTMHVGCTSTSRPALSRAYLQTNVSLSLPAAGQVRLTVLGNCCMP